MGVGKFLLRLRMRLPTEVLDQVMLNRVAHQFNLRAHAHLDQDVGFMRADGFDAQRQFCGNLGQGNAVQDPAEHLVFPIGQQGVWQGLAVG